MSGRGAGVGVFVIAVGEIGSMIDQETEAAFTPLVVVSLQIVAAKLVDHDDHYEFGPCVVSRGEGCDGENKTNQQSGQRTARGLHRAVVYSVGGAEPRPSRTNPVGTASSAVRWSEAPLSSFAAKGDRAVLDRTNATTAPTCLVHVLPLFRYSS